jgi:hypothetical protein
VLPQLAVTCKIEAECYYQTFVQVDRVVLRNRQLRQHANRCATYKNRMRILIFAILFLTFNQSFSQKTLDYKKILTELENSLAYTAFLDGTSLAITSFCKIKIL